MKQEKVIIMIMGYPGSGKSTLVNSVPGPKLHLNRDMFDKPGKVCSSEEFYGHLENAIKKLKYEDVYTVVVDNTFPTVERRKPIVDLGEKYGFKVECWWLQTSIEDTEVNVVRRMMQRNGTIMGPDDKKLPLWKNDSNMFPVSVLFQYRKNLQEPTMEEGFTLIKKVPFKRVWGPEYVNKAIIFDFDGTLRETKSGSVCPNSPDDIVIRPNVKETLERYYNLGYRLLGISNQAGIARGHVTSENVEACFTKTLKLLQGTGIGPVAWCPHNSTPIQCYCRKPMPGLGVMYIEQYKLDPSQCIMVGDMTSDKTFASRCGFKFIHESEFFNDEQDRKSTGRGKESKRSVQKDELGTRRGKDKGDGKNLVGKNTGKRKS